MKAARLHQYDHRPVVEEVPEPHITRPHDVIVKIGGAGLCRTDLHIIEGQWKEKSGVALPYTLGHENAGWVHAVGSAVENVAVGAGGLGHIGIQALRALTPAEIIVVDRSDAALKLAEGWGASHVVRADGTQIAQVMEITNGNGAEAVIDFVGEKGAVEDGVAM